MPETKKDMIGKKEETHSNGLHNALTTGTVVIGNIQADTDFRLDGQVEGDITCNGKIVVGPQGKVVGKIHGEVKGTLKIAEKLILKATGAITGDVATQSLEIEPNGRFNGQCTMNHPEA